MARLWRSNMLWITTCNRSCFFVYLWNVQLLLLRTNKLPALTCQISSYLFRYFYFPTIMIFPSGPTPPFSISSLSASRKICIPLFLERRSRRERKNNDSNFFPFSTCWLARECRLAAPVLATGAWMRSEREQLIKSSSRSAESQFCSPSTMISFYPDVMSYGTFALGNAMSSISAFHLLHKQGWVISFLSYLHNQSARLGAGSTDTPMEMPMVFLWITTHWKNTFCSLF